MANHTYRGVLFSPDGRHHEQFMYSDIDDVLAGIATIRGHWPRFPLAVVIDDKDRIVHADDACKRLVNMDFERARLYLRVNFHAVSRDPDIISD